MSARAIWKGVLRLEDVEVPVKLYSAVEDKRVSFRLLHREDGVPVKQVMVNPDTGKVVQYEDIQRGYVTPEGRIVRLDPSELDELEPEPSRDIEVLRFVPPDAIEHRWFERPYYLGPDGDADAYFALAAALARAERVGVARWVMRAKEYQGALRLHEGYPMLVTLKHAEEVLPLEEFEPRSEKDLDEKQLKMARQLIQMLADDFEPEAYQDEYRESVLALIESKREGKKVRPKKAPKRPRTDDLTAALERSLAAGGDKAAASA